VTGAAEYADIAKLMFRERQKAKKSEVLSGDFCPRRENRIFWPAGALSLDLGPFDG
jgi:hypothetical protein